jgi:hypothetical protein
MQGLHQVQVLGDLHKPQTGLLIKCDHLDNLDRLFGNLHLVAQYLRNMHAYILSDNRWV